MGQTVVRARLADIAAAAGVSKSLASRVLNGYADVAREETRRRVLEAAQRLQYMPSAAALAVAGAPTRALAFLVPPLSNPVYVRIVRGAFHEALKHGIVIVIVEDVDANQAMEAILRLCRAGRIDGVLMASACSRHPLVAWLRDGDVPHVFVNRAVSRSRHNVVMNDGEASELAWRHLWNLGHQDVGLIAGPSDIEPARRREQAFRRAAARSGREIAVEHVPFSEDGGAAGLNALLSRRPTLTAVFSSSLSQAMGALGAAATNGVAIPERLSLITYDDLPTADYLTPPLTTVRMPLAELGAAAVTAVVAQINGVKANGQVVEAPPELIVRSSTAAPGPARDRTRVVASAPRKRSEHETGE